MIIKHYDLYLCSYSFVYRLNYYIFLVGIPTKAGIAVAFSEEKWLVICEKLYGSIISMPLFSLFVAIKRPLE